MVRVEALLLFQFCVLSVLNDMSFLDKFRQEKFKLRDFRGELKRYNTKFLKMIEIVTYKYNRTTPAVNGSFIYKIDIEDDIQVMYYEIQICTERKVVIQAYKFASNEYRMFPMRFQVNMCKALKADIVGFRRAMTCGNTTNCHFSKNVHYYVCNYFPDATKFPPNIPNGLFKIEAQLLYKQQELMVMDYYIEIYTTFNQHKFKLKDFRGELKSFNPKLMRKAEILTYKYNRSIAAVNGSFIYGIDIEENIQVIVQAYKFASNEYRRFPIHFQIDFCDAITSNVVGLRKLLLCGNATKDCYFRKNVHYYVCNFFPDSSKFPPNIPSGQFMFETQLLYKNQELMVLDYYVEVYTPINY